MPVSPTPPRFASGGITGFDVGGVAPRMVSPRNGEFDANQLLNLAKQIAANAGNLSGGIYGTRGEGVGFAFDEATKILGREPTAKEQVFLDMARNLIGQGVTDVGQLSVKDIIGEADVMPVRDEATGQITGYQRWIGDYESGQGRWKALTPEEVAKVATPLS